MATISFTIASREKGVLNVLFNLDEDGINRILNNMKIMYEEEANDVEPELVENAAGEEIEVKPEPVFYSYKDVCGRIGHELVHSLLHRVMEQERRLQLRTIQLKPIEIIDET